MWAEHHNLFNKLAEAVGNRYYAVRIIAKRSRTLSNKVPGYLLESQLITWALTGNEPKFDDIVKLNHCRDATTEEILSSIKHIEDEHLLSIIIYMYKQSVSKKELSYYYPFEEDCNILARARILLRMVWYDFNFED